MWPKVGLDRKISTWIPHNLPRPGENSTFDPIEHYNLRVDDVQFEVLDFTEDVEEFIQFVDGVEAYGGGDIHENVLWGMDKCINEMSWSRMSKLVIHILDAPPHGRQFGDYGDEDPDWFQHDYKDVQVKIF